MRDGSGAWCADQHYEGVAQAAERAMDFKFAKIRGRGRFMAGF